MKAVLPLLVFSLTLNGCITVNNTDNRTGDGGDREPAVEDNNDPTGGGDDPVDGENPDGGSDPVVGDGGQGPVNTAPDISGLPSVEINLNTDYLFTPQSQDSDGDPLTFMVANLPSWANFNTNTGEINGTPTLERLYENIVISVSDGFQTVSLSPFDINVTVPSPLSVTIKWQAPSEDLNNNPLGEIQAYKIFYRVSQGVINKSITVNNGSATEFTIDNIVPGEYFFSMAVITESGMESATSNEFFFQIDQ
jgi:hypothetical protein